MFKHSEKAKMDLIPNIKEGYRFAIFPLKHLPQNHEYLKQHYLGANSVKNGITYAGVGIGLLLTLALTTFLAVFIFSCNLIGRPALDIYNACTRNKKNQPEQPLEDFSKPDVEPTENTLAK